MSPSVPTDTVRQAPSESPRKKSSIARKLVQAAALAAMIVPLGTVAVETASITCGFGYSESSGDGCYGLEGGGRKFDFGQYDLTLDFDSFNSETIIIEALETTQAAIGGRLAAFPTHNCVTISGPLDPKCVEFIVTAPGGLGFYDVFIHWDDITTNGPFPNEPGNRIRLLHAVGDDTYDLDITDGEYDPDPGIGGRDNNFQRLLVTHDATVVPEPATMLLIGSGLGTLLYQRRRRRMDAGGKPNA